MEEELKPCPFCGGEARHFHDAAERDHKVECRDCKTNISGYPIGRWAKEAWNTRPALYDAAPDLLEALKWFVEHSTFPAGAGNKCKDADPIWMAGFNRALSAIDKAEGAEK